MNHSDTQTIINIHRQAFGDFEGEEVAEIAKAFLALPDTISISAERDGKIVGNVLFTPFAFENHQDAKCYLLAPCGVLPQYQGVGVGDELMNNSNHHLKSIGTDVIFVLGVPAFYPRYGYIPTDKQTPYPDLLTIPESWMALELSAGVLKGLSGKTRAVQPIMQPSFWDTSMYE